MGINTGCDCDCLHKDELDKATNALKKSSKWNAGMCEFFKTFSDETRLKIINILDNVGTMCVCDMAVALNITKSAISHQLASLKKLNLVVAKKMGKEVFYSLVDEHIKIIYELGLEHVKEGVK